MSSAETIYALATPPGKSGVAVLRLSGPRALAALKSLSSLQAVTPRHAYVVTFRHPQTQEVIDKGLALYFPAPRSFTGEDVVECHMHGSLAVISEMLAGVSAIEGLRSAEPGEFTRRAFIQGKMDLIEAEGLADLIEAETSRQKSQALRQMQGNLSGFYERLRSGIIGALAHLEAYIDFPDEEIPESVLAALDKDIEALQVDIQAALQDRQRGERLRDGISVVILGAPNAGKSSLLNLVARREVAIVSHKAGTTRDAIEIHLDIHGFPVIMVDTAGLRDSDEDIEVEGIRRALARAQSADIKLVLFDGAGWPHRDSASLALCDAQTLTIVTKSDLIASNPAGHETAAPDSHPDGQYPAQSLCASQDNILFISVKTGEGMDRLLAALEERVIGFFSGESAPLITRARHRALLLDALKYLNKSLAPLPLELKCEELRQATQAVGKITGKIQVDDVLDVIFRSFCIGK